MLQEWTLTSENGGNIQLTFVSFDVGYTGSCTGYVGSYTDYVEVSYGSYSEKLCGDEVPETITSCGSMVIKFHSDSYTTAAGFRAEWEELTPTCDAANCLTYPANYPCNYPNNADEVT